MRRWALRNKHTHVSLRKKKKKEIVRLKSLVFAGNHEVRRSQGGKLLNHPVNLCHLLFHVLQQRLENVLTNARGVINFCIFVPERKWKKRIFYFKREKEATEEGKTLSTRSNDIKILLKLDNEVSSVTLLTSHRRTIKSCTAYRTPHLPQRDI